MILRIRAAEGEAAVIDDRALVLRNNRGQVGVEGEQCLEGGEERLQGGESRVERLGDVKQG
jgi:hypothetical protein